MKFWARITTCVENLQYLWKNCNFLPRLAYFLTHDSSGKSRCLVTRQRRSLLGILVDAQIWQALSAFYLVQRLHGFFQVAMYIKHNINLLIETRK